MGPGFVIIITSQQLKSLKKKVQAGRRGFMQVLDVESISFQNSLFSFLLELTINIIKLIHNNSLDFSFLDDCSKQKTSFTKSPSHSAGFAGTFSVQKIREKEREPIQCIMECKIISSALTLNFISILSISPPIKSTMFSPCFSRKASSSSIVWKVLISCQKKKKKS